MTEDEPEPFTMPIDPEAGADPEDAAAEDEAAPDEAAPDEAAPDEAPEVGGADEDLAALADEAARAIEALAEEHDEPDGTSDALWGTAAPSEAGAVWDDAATASTTNVWDLDDDEVADWGDATDADPEASPATTPPAPTPEPPAPPAAAAGMEAERMEDEVEEPESFTFPLSGEQPAVTSPVARGDDEPETFRFGAGPASTAPADEAVGPAAADRVDPVDPVDSVDSADDDEPEPFTFGGAADEEGDDDDVWTSDVARDDTTPLAEAARPREDTGWHDHEAAAEPRWTVPDLPARPAGDEDDDEPASFVASVSPGDAGDGRSAATAHAEVAAALGDLLDTEAEADPSVLDDLELDHLDDMVAAAEAGAAAPDEASTPSEAPAADEAAAPDDEGAADDEADPEEPLDAPAAARKVMEPGEVTFSSGRKKRGLFR